MVYHSDGFLDSAVLVRIMLPSLVLGALTRLLGQLLMSYRREVVNLRIVAINFAFNVLCGACLISTSGAYGAAITLLLTSLVDCGLHYLAARGLLSDESPLVSDTKFVSVWHTLVSSVVMAGILMMIEDSHVVWQLMIGSLTFVACFAALNWRAGGRTAAFRERFLVPLREN